MPPVSIAALVGASLISLIAGAGMMYLALKLKEASDRLKAIEIKLNTPIPARQWLEDMKLDHRAQLLSVAALVKLSARDSLDALYRVSPGLVEEVLAELKLKQM